MTMPNRIELRGHRWYLARPCAGYRNRFAKANTHEGDNGGFRSTHPTKYLKTCALVLTGTIVVTETGLQRRTCNT